MLALPLPESASAGTVLCLGAHCDDVEIGCGGALMALADRHPGLRFVWQVFSGDAARAAETRGAARRLLGERVEVRVASFRGSYFPAEWAAIKDLVEALRVQISPAVVFTHRLEDRHQDHRVVAELTWNAFRDHLVLEYEIAKYEGDLGHPNLFVPVSRALAARKLETLRECFVSQHRRSWFSDDTFHAQLRLRGIECNAPEGLAEAFHARKLRLCL